MFNINKGILRRIKTLVIIVLGVLAVYQTGRLWFVNITNRSFFVYFAALFDAPAPDGYTDIVRPMRVVFGNGDGRFDMRYGVNEPTADNAIAEILRRGDFVGTSDAAPTLNAALRGPIVLYEYAFTVNSDIFAPAFNSRTGAALTDRGLESFNAVAVVPAGVIFLDSERAWTFALPSGQFQLPDFYIDDNLYFNATDTRIFLPRTQDGWRHNTLRMTNPYANRLGEVQLHSVNAQVSYLFDNPAIRNPRMVDNVITISTINTRVRYFPGNILEYNCFRPIRRGERPDFMTDFSGALAFVNNDPHASSHDFYLAGFESRGRTHVFWFNYVIGGTEAGGFPLLTPEDGWGPTHDPLPYPIEVVVDHGRVTRYRKLAFTFGLDTLNRQTLTPGALNIPTREGERFMLGFPAEQGAGLEIRLESRLERTDEQ
ncbi:MAG: hypothetical protein FWD90_07680 [Defluviitaleaceae bacterium]|nr:hypothetical protein [Defluviitaleaceae bacterium]